MLEPDFGESQLQQFYNAELTREFLVFGIQPIIPTQPAEKDFGWDTGFNIPWFKPPDPAQKNCNLFLQYKLSYKMVGRTAGQWNYWGKPYYKFKIAMWKNTGHPRGNYPDFHQYDALKKLADNGYPTFYVTNNTLDLNELVGWAKSRGITANNPALDIGDISHDRHLVATFTGESNHFFLDSEPEKKPKMEIPSQLLKQSLKKADRTSMVDDIHIIPRLLAEHKAFIEMYEMRRKRSKSSSGSIEADWMVLYHTLSQVFGLTWWKLSI